MAIAKKCYLDDLLPPSDALEHEAVARDVAGLLGDGRMSDAFAYFSVGNPAYQCSVGVFYALTGASEVILYTVNGALAFWGLLGLLEIISRHTRCARVPLPVTTFVMLLPSAMFWTTTNLKEGPVLWGICMMLYLTIPASQRRGWATRALPIVGLFVTAILRPHIAAAWLLGIAAGAMVERRRIGLLVSSGLGVSVSIVLLSLLAPHLFENAARDGVTTMLAERYDTLSVNDSVGGTSLTGEAPIPVLSGLILIALRPWPIEVHGSVALLVALEVWVLAGFGMFHWFRAAARRRLLMHPAIVTSVVVLLLLGFFFSYMHNMGLVVRQRLMCFPALLCIYMWPLMSRRAIGIEDPAGKRQWDLDFRRPAAVGL